MKKQKAKSFMTGQTVTFTSGVFKGKTGKVQFTGDSGRVFVKINGTLPDANGRRTKAGGAFVEPQEIE